MLEEGLANLGSRRAMEAIAAHRDPAFAGAAYNQLASSYANMQGPERHAAGEQAAWALACYDAAAKADLSALAADPSSWDAHRSFDERAYALLTGAIDSAAQIRSPAGLYGNSVYLLVTSPPQDLVGCIDANARNASVLPER